MKPRSRPVQIACKPQVQQLTRSTTSLSAPARPGACSRRACRRIRRSRCACSRPAGSDRDPLIRMPLGIALLVPRRIHNWAFETVPQPGLGGPPGLSATRQDAGRQQLDQRDGLHPRSSQRLRRVGGARQRGLVLCRRAALFSPGGAQRAHRRRLSRTGRTAQCSRPALAVVILGALGRGRGTAGHETQRGLQRRGTGRGRALSADAEERRALERRASLSRAEPRPAQPQRCAPVRARRASCSRSGGRSESSTGKAAPRGRRARGER